jgi:hypothetical protein
MAQRVGWTSDHLDNTAHAHEHAHNLHCRVDAGKVELDGSTYFGLSLPFDITQLIWIEVLLMGGAELYRNTELDPERRCYPGELHAGTEHGGLRGVDTGPRLQLHGMLSFASTQWGCVCFGRRRGGWGTWIGRRVA